MMATERHTKKSIRPDLKFQKYELLPLLTMYFLSAEGADTPEQAHAEGGPQKNAIAQKHSIYINTTC